MIWSPFDIYPNYWGLFTLELVATCHGGYTGGGFDCLISSLTIRVAYNCDVLGHRFLKVPELVQSYRGKYKKAYQKKLLTPLIQQHVDIYEWDSEYFFSSLEIPNILPYFRITKDISRKYAVTLFLQLTLTAGVLSFTFYKLTREPITDVAKLVTLLTYGCTAYVQFLIYCAPGDYIKLKVRQKSSWRQ